MWDNPLLPAAGATLAIYVFVAGCYVGPKFASAARVVYPFAALPPREIPMPGHAFSAREPKHAGQRDSIRDHKAAKGAMSDVRRVAPDVNAFKFFDSTRKYPKRANLFAHGELGKDGTALIVGSEHRRLDPRAFAEAAGDLSGVDCIRLVICHSANGDERSFAQQFANITGKRVKAFKGTVAVHRRTSIDDMVWAYDINFDAASDHATQQNMHEPAAYAAEQANSALNGYYSAYRMKLAKSRPWKHVFECINPFNWTYEPKYFEPQAVDATDEPAANEPASDVDDHSPRSALNAPASPAIGLEESQSVA
jgi:hypothetical protein